MYMLYPPQLARLSSFFASTEWQEVPFPPTRTYAYVSDVAGATLCIPGGSRGKTTLYFHRHRWSGWVRITCGGQERSHSLYSLDAEDLYGIEICVTGTDAIMVQCLGRPDTGSLLAQVWLVGVRYEVRPWFFPPASRLDLGGVGYIDGFLTVNTAPNCNIHCDFRNLDLPLGGGQLEDCKLTHTLEHIPAHQIWSFLQEIYRRLTHKGTLTIVQTDAASVIQQWVKGEISFASLRNIIFAPPQAVRIDHHMAHHYMWSEASLRVDLGALGFWSESFDAGQWSFNIRDELVPEDTQGDLGKPIRNLGVIATKLSGQVADGRHHIDPALEKYGRKLFSQNNEDGVLLHLLAALEVKNGSFVEVGISKQPTSKPVDYAFGFECNCWVLYERGWSGLWIDSGPLPAELPHVRAKVTPGNINSLLANEPDVFSLDIDGQDFYIWQAVKVQPKIVIIEYNASIPYGLRLSVPLEEEFEWDGTNFFGASFSALTALGEVKGYTCVYANGVNLFFVRSDLVSNLTDFPPDEIYRHARFHRDPPPGKRWIKV
jgi:hypothetical protein